MAGWADVNGLLVKSIAKLRDATLKGLDRPLSMSIQGQAVVQNTKEDPHPRSR